MGCIELCGGVQTETETDSVSVSVYVSMSTHLEESKWRFFFPSNQRAIKYMNETNI